MKTFTYVFGVLLVTLVFPPLALASAVTDFVEGRVVLQIERNGEAWYVNPDDDLRYYLGGSQDTSEVITHLGVGITTANLKRIPKPAETWTADSEIMESVRGKILLQVERNGEAWYVNPVDGKRYFLRGPKKAWSKLTKFGLGISNEDINKIDIGTPGQELPSSMLLNVPFTSQAPYGNWGSPYDEACEEADLTMANVYIRHIGLSPAEADASIRNIVDWETATYGFHEDTSAEYTARTARELLGMDATVSYRITERHIKSVLANGHVILAPVYGKALYNPHYKNGGPYYHMILIVGYEGGDFITHDPGTRYGEHYRYPVEVLLNAAHDWTNPETNVANGTPAMVIVR